MPSVDVGVDGRGEFFGLRFDGGDRVDVSVVDVWPDKRHLAPPPALIVEDERGPTMAKHHIHEEFL